MLPCYHRKALAMPSFRQLFCRVWAQQDYRFFRKQSNLYYLSFQDFLSRSIFLVFSFRVFQFSRLRVFRFSRFRVFRFSRFRIFRFSRFRIFRFSVFERKQLRMARWMELRVVYNHKGKKPRYSAYKSFYLAAEFVVCSMLLAISKHKASSFAITSSAKGVTWRLPGHVSISKLHTSRASRVQPIETRLWHKPQISFVPSTRLVVSNLSRSLCIRL
jgi:hypothetical protein